MWLRGIPLNDNAKEILAIKAATALPNANIKLKELRRLFKENTKQLAKTTLKSVNYDSHIYKLLGSFLFWAEGAKISSHVHFTNSDPRMIFTFLYILRKSFEIDES